MATIPAQEAPSEADVQAILPKVELVAEDGEPLETDWHRGAMNLLIENVVWPLRGRDDFYLAGNMFIYFSEKQARHRDYRGPDFFFVDQASRTPQRDYWAVWLEDGRYPDVIIELSSPSTRQVDYTTKKDLYERVFRTYEYYIYDPFTLRLDGWRLIDEVYTPLKPNEQGWLECKKLGWWLGKWSGKYLGHDRIWLRFFDAQGRLVPIEAEAAQQQAEAAQQQAEAAQRHAEVAQRQAGAERQRAEAAETELARLKAQLAASKQAPPSSI